MSEGCEPGKSQWKDPVAGTAPGIGHEPDATRIMFEAGVVQRPCRDAPRTATGSVALVWFHVTGTPLDKQTVAGSIGHVRSAKDAT